MIPLLHHSGPFDLPLSSEAKYVGQDRSYSNLQSYPSNDYAFSHRRPQTTLTNCGPASMLTLPTNSEFNSQPLLNDGIYHSNTCLLSPPDSVNGSNTAPGNSMLNNFAYSTLPKPQPSNESTSNHFPSVAGSILSSNWDQTMTSLERPRATAFPPASSPPLTYTSANSLPTGFLTKTLLGPHEFSSYQSRGNPMGPRYGPSNGFTLGQQNPFPCRTSYTARHISEIPYNNSAMNGNSEPAGQLGPPFGETKILLPIVAGRNQHLQLRPEIIASIQKGFFQVDGKWTCYRRNYFTVCCSFNFKNHAQEGPFFVQRRGQFERIQNFGVSISAKTAVMNNQESEVRGLVQHTPKRDKATESTPTRQVIQPASAPPAQSGASMGLANPLYPSSVGVAPGILNDYGGYEPAGHQAVPASCTFERIQFQKATANNGKRRAQQQYFHVVVELSVNIARNPGEEHLVVVATKESDQMVVRGRSPSHYKDGIRRDSQTSMDPDHGTGPGSDANPGSYSYGSHNSSGMDWAPTPRNQQQHHHHHHHQQYGGATYRGCGPMDYSPTSVTSSTTLTGSPTDVDFCLSDTQTAKSSKVYSVNSTTLIPLPEGGDDDFFHLDRHSLGQKRPFEEDSTDDDFPAHRSSDMRDNFASSSFDSPAISHPKALCASS